VKRELPDYWPTEERRGSVIGRLFRGLLLMLAGAACGAAAIIALYPETMSSVRRHLMRPSAATEPVAVPDGNLIGKQAQDWGVSACLPRIVTLSQFLTQGADTNWLLTRSSEDADGSLFAATIVAHEPASGLRGISSFYAAPVGSGCNTAYESTIYLQRSCADARANVFPAFTARIDAGPIAEAYATPDGSGRLFLLPAGESGCVAVKSEVTY
jgi:hypothetical protein